MLAGLHIAILCMTNTYIDQSTKKLNIWLKMTQQFTVLHVRAHKQASWATCQMGLCFRWTASVTHEWRREKRWLHTYRYICILVLIQKREKQPNKSSWRKWLFVTFSVLYHWQEQYLFVTTKVCLSRQNFCRKIFLSQQNFCRNKHKTKTHLLTRQKYACHNKTFVTTNIFLSWQT